MQKVFIQCLETIFAIKKYLSNTDLLLFLNVHSYNIRNSLSLTNSGQQKFLYKCSKFPTNIRNQQTSVIFDFIIFSVGNLN